MDQNKGAGQQQQGRKPGDEQLEPNQNADREPAEGARDNVRSGQNPNQPGGGQNPGQPGSGTSNRPLDREQQEQREVPPRGETKDEDRDA